MLKSTHFTTIVTLLLALLVSVPAFAGDKGLAAPLGEVEWGDSKDEVLDKIKDQMLDELRKRDDLRRDRVAMQRARKRIIDKHKEVAESYETLTEKSGYKVSVIADEFNPNNGESMLRVKDRVASRYYFFVDGGLYKFVVAYNQDYLQDVGFEPFVVQTAKKYGRPDDTAYGDVAGEEELKVARWMDKKTVLRVENEKEFFGTFKMVFADRSTLERMNAIEKTLTARDSGEQGISAEVEGLKQGPVEDENTDVVDGLVGDVDVELNKGRPKDDQVRHDQKGSASSGEVASKEKSKSKKKSKKKKSKSKKKKKDRDFSDLESSSGGEDDLIIY
ncbi:MAG: hypothetical protein ACQEVA_01395 [Myxococcota bacterium]